MGQHTAFQCPLLVHAALVGINLVHSGKEEKLFLPLWPIELDFLLDEMHLHTHSKVT